MNCFKAFLSLTLVAASSSARAESIIKFASLAPDGSPWIAEMSELNKELQEKTGGQVKLKVYPGGVSGDEKDMIRKMRLGQLQAAGITGMGLGEINGDVRVLDSPFLFKNLGEVDAVLSKFHDDFAKAFSSKGFFLLGWTEVGFVHLFTNAPIREVKDLQNVKLWVWEGDAIAEALFKAMGVHPIPLSITDVMTSLQTGLINGVYCPPMASIVLQWFTKTKYMHSAPIAYSAGAVVVAQKALDGLTAEQRKALVELSRRHLKKLTEISRKQNQEAVERLKKEGLTVTEPTPAALKSYDEIGQKARRELAGKLYSAELLGKVERALADARAHAKSR